MSTRISCTSIGILIILIGSIGNWFCICVFSRKRFHSSILTPFFIALLIADCLYLTFRVIKILYYQQTLFLNFFPESFCSKSLLIDSYAYFTRRAPQILVPLSHYEFYVRFSLLLMLFISIQRAYDMFHSSYSIVATSQSTRSFSYILIILAFILAYLFELLGLSIFCSYELSSNTAYEWYSFIQTNLSNETTSLISFMKNQSSTQSEIDCVMLNENVCSREELIRIVRYYFDMHQRIIVDLIHKVQLSTVGTRMPRNELRVKYHYHSCPIRLHADFFLQVYNLLYSRKFGFNRYTSILVVGSIIPSIMTISSNAVSLYYIVTIRGSVHQQSRFSRRRTDETRRVILIITIECLLAIINSWFVDIILSIKHCGHSLAIGDDCPHFFRRSQAYLFICDVFNSMSNIILHCFAGRRFRHELRRMVYSWIYTIKKRIPCYCQIRWKTANEQKNAEYDDKRYIAPSESSTRLSKGLKPVNEPRHASVKLRVTTNPIEFNSSNN